MQQEIFLEKNKSRNSVNSPSQLNVEMENKMRLVPYTSVEDTLDIYKQYTKERDETNKYRLIFTINPIISNVLFNTRTEIVKDEGSDACKLYIGGISDSAKYNNFINTTSLDWIQGIRDTEYTHPEIYSGCVYHCGYDIFNNHMLRSTEFTHINQIQASDGNRMVYNTLKDYARNSLGETINGVTENSDGISQTTENKHTYRVDSLMSMKEAFLDKCIEKDGWYGFTNPTYISIPNGIKGNDEKDVNKLMNNNKACEFIDMYPDRSLFSFIPKKNKYRKRLEYNWDYTITYPYANDTEMFNKIMGLDDIYRGTKMVGTNKVAAIKIYNVEKNTLNPIYTYVKFEPVLRHNIRRGDYITLFYFVQENSVTKLKRFPKKIRVMSVGDNEGKNTNRYFSINLEEISMLFSFNEDGELCFKTDLSKKAELFYKRNVSGNDCKYYFRKFKKLDTELNSMISKLSFGENIYGDRMSQIIYTDDLNIEGLTDNLGRPLGEAYLTIIKTNRGHERWYNYKPENVNQSTSYIGNTEVEFSHCFSKVTSGLDLSPSVSEKIRNYNARTIHNLNLDNIEGKDYRTMAKAMFGELSVKTIPIEDNITLSGYDEFYGDIVEFDPVNYKETVIEKVYHRFNTEQRETTNKWYYDVIYDNLIADDYDKDINKSESSGFKVSTEYLNKTKIVGEDGEKYFPANINPEGYFYLPHNRIALKELSDTVNESAAVFINCSGGTLYTGLKEEYYDDDTGGKRDVLDEYGMVYYYDLVIIESPIDKDFKVGSKLGFYDKETQETIWGSLVGVSGNAIAARTEYLALDNYKLINNGYIVNYVEDECATYAEYLINAQKYVWRDYLKPSELSNESKLYNRTFSNGAIYVPTNINFHVRRQDPRNEYGLRNTDEYDVDMDNVEQKARNTLSSFKMLGWDNIDFSNINFIINADNDICY